MDFVDGFKIFIRKQLTYGVLTALALHVIPVSIYIGGSSMGSLSWFSFWNYTFFSIRFWLSLTPLLVPMVFVGMVTLQTMSSRSKVVATRFQVITGVFSVLTVLKAVAYLLLSILLPFTFINISGQSVYKPCSFHPEMRCFNAPNLYVVVCGVWTGLCYFFRYQLFPKQVRFPIIVQLKSDRIRRHMIASAFAQSFRRTVVPVMYFIAVFYITSSSITTTMSKIYNCRMDPEDSFWLFVNPKTLLHSWLMSSMVYFSMWTLVKCVKIYLTDLYRFQLQELIPALSAENYMLQLHAFHELYLLSLGRIGNVSEVFTLSQPGGIPHTWNAILQESLRAIKEVQNGIEVVSGTNAPTSAHIYEQPLPPSVAAMRLRRLGEGEHLRVKPMEPSVFEVFSERIQKLACSAMALAPLRFMFAPVPEDQIATILESSQHAVWAVESLAVLTGRAIKEDQFGVVVNAIPSIVLTILSLRATLEKTKLGGPGKQRHRDRPGRMKAALLSAVSRGLCRIAVTYADFLDDLYLPPDALKALRVHVT